MLKDYRFKFVPVSDNAKTGKMAAIYTATCQDKTGSCPARCPFASAGCYAKNGPCAIHWENTTKSETTVDNLKNTILSEKKRKKVLRHNVAGDLAITDTSNINKSLIEKLTAIFKTCFDVAYSYTHCTINKRNISLVKKAMQENFIINFSTESVSDAKKCIDAGVNCVIACETMQEKIVIIDGVKIVKCPNSYNKSIQCVNCGLCYQKNRKFAIAFPVHGNQKGKAIKAGFLGNL